MDVSRSRAGIMIALGVGVCAGLDGVGLPGEADVGGVGGSGG